MMGRATLLLCATLSLLACDAWPTRVANRSQTEIVFAWRDRGFEQWSVPFALPSGKAVTLGRDEYAEEFIGVRVIDGAHVYELAPASIARLQEVCGRNAIERVANLAGDCLLAYRGNGRLTVRRPADVNTDPEWKEDS
jgi:hypothetical protein